LRVGCDGVQHYRRSHETVPCALGVVCRTGGELLGLGCHAAVRVTLSPGDTTVSVGSRYTAFVLISECNEDRPANPTLTYSSQDTTVATVEPATGVVTAVAVGSTLLTATGAEFGQRYNAGTVTVR
jgi:uncharacterized protein YjdB